MPKFKCIRCGQCCGPIPFPPKMLARFNSLAQRTYIEMPYRLDKMYIIPKTEDNKCIFLKILDDGTTECVIYNNRPAVCKKQGNTKNPMLQCPHSKKSSE